jgi:imidazolonepropionase
VSTLFYNIKGLVQARTEPMPMLKGKDMATLPVIENAWLTINEGKIEGFGEMKSLTDEIRGSAVEQHDVAGRFVFPSWVDSHTHIVYAGNRESEFVDRIKGLSYAEIAAKGGGILNSASKLAGESEEALLEAAFHRLDEVMAQGTGAVEIKSGYGLTVDNEMKILRVIRKLSDMHPLRIKSTLLGAHAIPAEFKNNKSAYINLVIDEMIPRVAQEGLAEYIDVFCEANYFDVEDTHRILEAGVKHGLKPKTHVNQFTILGGVKASIDHGAISVDHLEELGEADITALLSSTTIPVALPLCSLFLSIPYTPGRRLIDAGLPLALASDYNPGSSPSGNMNLAVALACIKMRLTPEEAINAATINGAAAIELLSEMGSIAVGNRASFFITEPVPSFAYLPYSFGANHVDKVYIDGMLR